MLKRAMLCTGIAAWIGCGDPDDGQQQNESEVITSVSIVFSPSGGGDDITAEFDDPDGDGGEPPTIDEIELLPGEYAASVSLSNRLEDPPEDITEEILDEAAEHQIFFTGSAVDGPASDVPGAPLVHSYADADENGFPIGIDSTIIADSGSGDLVITLRHMPPISGSSTKDADTALAVKSGGFEAISGSTDAQVTFEVTVP